MKYSDLFTLNPIESVIKIEQANQKQAARNLVASFVITPSLGEAIRDVALPQLDFSVSAEGKGIFVVGNYGTGKSHVMSVLSLIAEDAAYLSQLNDAEWRERFRPIAGRYSVQRTELGGTLMGFYDIVTHELGALARKEGIEFTFKSQTQLINVKSEFQRFMAAFEEKRPGRGVLFMIDELLEYIRSRSDDQLLGDLPVLRALGEFCDGSRFVFMAGVQQKLFSDRRFNHLAEEVKRVGQRYYDFVIDDRSVGQLIEGYLFKKTEVQRDRIRELLTSQCKLYEVLAPELEQFVAMFPAHPRFIAEFQRVFVVERREILTVLTREARTLLDREVDRDGLELITSDRYWCHVERDQRLRSVQDVSRVVQNIATITAHMRQEFGPNDDLEGALRLVHALAVNRLTTPGISDPIGLTPKDLKNNLLWRTPLAIEDSEFLTLAAKRLLERTRAAANGQFLAVSETSGQYFIDPTRDRDYPQQVRTHARSIRRQTVQYALNELFTRALELPNEDPARDGRFWPYELMWEDKNAERPGWLFFGFPNQRSTAQPPRDFYLFVIPSQRITGTKETWSDAEDESYWFLEDFPAARVESAPSSTDGPETFLDILFQYASAHELGSACRGDEKTAFDTLAKKLGSRALQEFNEHAGEWISIRFNGQKKRFSDWVTELAPGQQQALFKTRVDAISRVMFAGSFGQKYPGYPVFPQRMYEGTRRQSAEAALEVICKVGQTTALGKAVLSALELYEGETPTPDTSPWLGKVRARLAELGPKQVLNNTDLFEKKEGRVWMKGEPLEAEWLLVVLAAGIEAGDLVVVGENNTRYDATDIPGFYQKIKTWEKVVRIARPSDVPVDRWRKLFRLVGAAEAKLANPNTLNDAIVDFQFRLQQHITRISQEMQDVTQVHPFEDPASREALKTSTELLGVVKERLGSLTVYNTRAKMQNLIMPDADIEQLGKVFKELGRVSDLLQFLKTHRRELQALERYRDILPTSLAPSFHEKLSALGSKLRDGYADPSAFADGPGRAALEQSLEAAVKEAISTYQRIHKLYSLDSEADKRKKRLLEGKELRRLNRLVMISAINKAPLEAVREALGRLPVYRSNSREDLLNSATSLCPHTKWDPRSLPENPLPALDVLAHCESEISRLHQAWIEQLLGELEDPAIKSALEALNSEERAPIQAFLTNRELPEKIEDSFISAVNMALSGLRRRLVGSKKLAKAVLGGSAPLKVSEVKDRFNRWLQDELQGNAPETVRFVLDE